MRLLHSLVAALALLGAAAFALRVASFRVSVIDWDESLYLVIVQRWLQGALPYLSVWDQHPIGLPALLLVLMRRARSANRRSSRTRVAERSQASPSTT